ncbi:MAG: hypothetical protein HY784_15675 [Chloroflexi bacterium]|nr:hypothetical protein [Chloroflexota bacterium]
MSEIVLSEPLATRIRREAESRGMEIETLIETALQHYRFQAQREKVKAESQWWCGLSPEVRARYTGEFVAIHDRAVVDHDRDEETLRQRIRARYGKTAVLLTPAEGRRELRFVSTRQVRP